MTSTLRCLVVFGAVMVNVACASQSASTNGAATAGGQRNLVTAAELAIAGDVDLYDALTRVRPTFLRPRIGGGTTGVQSSEVSVYYDGMQMREGLSHLREIAARSVQEVRFLEPQQANARFGTSNSAGALMITSKK